MHYEWNEHAGRTEIFASNCHWAVEESARRNESLVTGHGKCNQRVQRIRYDWIVVASDASNEIIIKSFYFHIALKTKPIKHKGCGHISAYVIGCINAYLIKHCPESVYNMGNFQNFSHYIIILNAFIVKHVHISLNFSRFRLCWIAGDHEKLPNNATTIIQTQPCAWHTTLGEMRLHHRNKLRMANKFGGGCQHHGYRCLSFMLYPWNIHFISIKMTYSKYIM